MGSGNGQPHIAAQPKGAAMKPVTMTIRQACEYSALSRSTIYNLINGHKLSSRKVGKRTLITTASIDALLNVEAA